MYNIDEDLKKEDIEKLLKVGVDIEEKNRIGSFLFIDKGIYNISLKQEGVEILQLKEALEKYPELNNYIFRIIDKDKDVYTRLVAKKGLSGFFIRTLPNVKTHLPIQTCFLIKKIGYSQIVHNIVIAEENSELNLINGCAAATYSDRGSHIAVTEFYVKKGAKISFTMIHDWAPNVIVRPRSAALVDEDGIFISNYVSLKKVRSTQSEPNIYLVGKRAKAKLVSILFADKDTHLDIGGKIFLNGDETSGEIISRVISDGGKIISKGSLIGKGKNIKAHMECNGIMLKDLGEIITIPELYSKNKDVEMSHEAIVGKIAKDEIEYLMSRGIKEDDAISLILRGFLNVKIEGLPEILQRSIDTAIELTFKGM
ncbi:MAG: SufD family Fe-S cluster assembly protein [Caldisericia bacterium]|nr:SufD family Fe-S cluster assembly protein [Caldisericia bacterium]